MEQFLQYLVNGLVLGSTYALVALGLSLIFGVLEVPDFAHGVFIMLGAYLTFYVVVGLHLSFFVAIPIVIVAMGIAGILKELVIYRPLRGAPELTLMLAAFALFQFVQNAALIAFGAQFSRSVEFPVRGTVHLGSVLVSWQRLTVVLLSVGVVILIRLFVSRTSFGRAMRAVAEDADSAAISGISVNRVHVLVFAISTALAGLAGLFLAGLLPIEPYMGSDQLLKAFAVIVLAGMGNVTGTIFGAFGLGVVEAYAQGYLPSAAYADGIAFAVLVLVLLIRPEGLSPIAGRREG